MSDSLGAVVEEANRELKSFGLHFSSVAQLLHFAENKLGFHDSDVKFLRKRLHEYWEVKGSPPSSVAMRLVS